MAVKVSKVDDCTLRARRFYPEGDKNHDPVTKHTLNGGRGAASPGAKGGRKVVEVPTKESKSVLTVIYAVDVCIRRSYLVNVIYC